MNFPEIIGKEKIDDYIIAVSITVCVYNGNRVFFVLLKGRPKQKNDEARKINTCKLNFQVFEFLMRK